MQARGGGGNIRDDAGGISLPLHPLGDVDPVAAGEDVYDAGDLGCARVGLAYELHRHEPHLRIVGTLRHRRRRREQSAELGHLGVCRLELRLEHLHVHLELLRTPGEAWITPRVIDGI